MYLMDHFTASKFVKKAAMDIGFDACGITRAVQSRRAGYLRKWLRDGRAGTMQYLHRHVDSREDPTRLLPGARSVIVVALSYNQPGPGGSDNPGLTGRVSRYAWGRDYHRLVKNKLLVIADRIRAEIDSAIETKVCVDTVPIMERDLAAEAGVGWIGKNTMVVNRELGSFFFLGAIVTTLELVPDDPLPGGCGTCTACLDACPTNALTAPYEMDASRCISYLTIEHRETIPPALAGLMGDWLFGCDICQDVCPYNRRPMPTREPRFAVRPPGPRPELEEVLSWAVEDYEANLRGSAAKRASFEMWQRNARIALSNARGRALPGG